MVDGENPEDVAFKWFGDAEFHWIILMTNNITDRYYQWPLSQPQFAEHLTDKYGAGNEDDTHHFEKTTDSGRTSSNGPNDYSHLVECNEDDENPAIITNRQYEQRKQDVYKRQGTFVFDNYDVKDGEKPEDIAFKYYGDAEYHWVILMTNNITDRYYQWPLTQPQFQEHLEDKYGAGNEDATHHFEKTTDSGRTTSNGPNDYSHLSLIHI